MSVEKGRRLGRGLEALIGASSTSTTGAAEMQRLPIAKIRPNPFQPRTEFSTEELSELQSSIAANGLLQPITVRRRGDAFELIAGERRLRATTNLGWKDVPAIVKDIDDQTLLVLALVENLQRSDLNPLEEARGYQRLLGEFGLTHQQVADAVGKDRTTISNLLRLLNLPREVQRALEGGRLSAGHSRALLALDDEERMLELASEIEEHGLSVRDVERRVRDSRGVSATGAGEGARHSKKVARGTEVETAESRAIADELRRYLQTDVSVQVQGSAKGSIRIAFYSSEDLDRLLDLILRERRAIY